MISKLLALVILTASSLALADSPSASTAPTPKLLFSIDWTNPATLQQGFGLGCGVTTYGDNPDVVLTVSGIYKKDFKMGPVTAYSVQSVRFVRTGSEVLSVITLDHGSPSDNDVNIEVDKLDGSKIEALITVDSGC